MSLRQKEGGSILKSKKMNATNKANGLFVFVVISLTLEIIN